MSNRKYVPSLVSALLLTTLSSISMTSNATAREACEEIPVAEQQLKLSTCFQYVKGFLDGALLSDKQIMRNLNGEDDELSGFAQRALRTRVGIHSSPEPLPDTLLADFCLPKSKASDAAVLKVVNELSKTTVKSQIDEELVYTKVKQLFPCS